MKCQHCNREVEQHNGQWIDPQATGDDAIWREVCDSHDTFTAEHQPMAFDAMVSAWGSGCLSPEWQPEEA